MWAFHGTPSDSNIAGIKKDGLRVGGTGVGVAHGAAHGRGVGPFPFQ